MTEARAALDVGDRARALASVNAALALDPEYLAAQALRERIERTPVVPRRLPDRPPATSWPPVSPVRARATTPPLPPAESPIVSPEGWARFEQRARSRRLDRRIAAARVAISRHRFDEARIILCEIREIDDTHPDLISLGIELDAEEHLSRRRPRRWGPAVAAVLIFAAVISGVRVLRPPDVFRITAALRIPDSLRIADVLRMPEALKPSASPAALGADAPATTERAEQTPSPMPEQPLASAPTAQNAPPEEDGVRDGQAPVPAPDVVQPSVAVTAAPAPIKPAVDAPIPQSVDARAASPERTAAPLPTITTGRLDQVPADGTGAAPLPPPAPTPPPLAPAVTPAVLPGTVAPEPAYAPEARVAQRDEPALPRQAASVSNAVVTAPRDEDLVRRTLQQYRAAYENLDARSAQAVWPRVDEAALQRAFAGLESQRLTFDDCQMDLRGPTGVATCRGTTLYVPKVGNREPHREPRIWTFDLRKVGDNWQIDSARTVR